MTITFEECPDCHHIEFRKECYIIPISKKEVFLYSECWNCGYVWYDYETINRGRKA